MKKAVVLLLVLATMMFSTMIFAATSGPVDTDGAPAEPQPTAPVAKMSIDEAAIAWSPKANSKGMVLTISGPDGLYLRQTFEGGVEMTLDAKDAEGQALPDGSYAYELYAIPETSADRDSVSAVKTSEAVVQSGHFRVYKGQFVTAVEFENAPAEAQETTNGNGTAGGNAINAQVFTQDVIVQGSQCVGVDCVNGESFGFDTIRLKENNLRIKFQDTSVSASFPSNDWQITANDSSNGGANKFSIEDIDGGKIPFTLIAGAPSNSLYVNASGNVGFGTSTPVVETHIVDGDSPTIRLEQNGSSGFQAQTWDIAGNETNFFVRDVTNGSKLPFKIKPSAPTNSLFIAADGDIGLGTQNPSAAMHMTGNDGNTQLFIQETSSTAGARELLRLSNTGGPSIKFEDVDNGYNWSIGVDADGLFFIDFLDAPGVEVTIDDAGEMFVPGGVSTNALRNDQAEIIAEQQKQIGDLEKRLAELEALVKELAGGAEKQQ